MNVLSLFDGISCGQVALRRRGIKVDQYYASEVDKSAIAITQQHFPDTIQLGDVTTIKGKCIQDIDLLMGGSPCQGFSFAGKQLNFDDPRSKLFFEFVRLKNEINPKYFLLENVSMKKEFRDVISDQLGVEPIMINSNDFSAQGRKRYYWTNIPVEKIVAGNALTVEDILDDNVEYKYWIKEGNSTIICENEITKNKITRNVGWNGSYIIHGETVVLNNKCTQFNELPSAFRYVMPCITPNRLNKRQNGRRFNPPFSKFYTLTTQDRHGILINGSIRQLTPLECERLQTLPDNYTHGMSDAKRYHAIGNGWTVNVISHIMKGMKL
jgi:DNA-cytosine methyltransferase